jgi:hypothetical protein
LNAIPMPHVVLELTSVDFTVGGKALRAVSLFFVI